MDKAASLYENKVGQDDLPRSREGREVAADKAQGAARRDLAMTTLAGKRATDDPGEQNEAKKRAAGSSTATSASGSSSSTSNSGALLEFFQEKARTDKAIHEAIPAIVDKQACGVGHNGQSGPGQTKCTFQVT